MRTVTITCDLCGATVDHDRAGRDTAIDTTTTPTTDNQPAIRTRVQFTKPGADDDTADLCRRCTALLLGRAAGEGFK